MRGQAEAAYAAKQYLLAGERFNQALRVPKAQPTGSDFYDAACVDERRASVGLGPLAE